MNNRILAMAIVGAVFVFGITNVEAQNFQEGKWSMTIVTKMDGMDQHAAEAAKAMEGMSPEEKAMMDQMMGGMGMGLTMNSDGMTTTTTQCLTGQNPIPDTNQPMKGCEQNHSINGNTVSFEIICPDSKSTGEVTYNMSSMNGSIKSLQTVDGQETTSTINISGQYVGPCDQ